MMYALLRAAAGIALRWFYRDIQVVGAERIPRDRPLLVVVNHPNALVDALVVGWLMPRRLLITAKATLFEHSVAAALLRWLGVLPLRRANDERDRPDAGRPLDPARNAETFRAVHDALRRGGAVLIFPEGKSHDEPALAPLKTGAARIALSARESSDVPGLTILPIGLVFEHKDAPRSRVLAQVGEPILVDEWAASQSAATADALTADIDARLRAVTLNYASTDDAARAAALASTVAALLTTEPSLRGAQRPLGAETRIARRIVDLQGRLGAATWEQRERADALARRLMTFRQAARAHGILIEDIGISLDERDAIRFVVREGWLILVGGPVALWGRLNHWLPFQAAAAIAGRSVESAADPAMRTIVAGAALVAVAYAAQTALVWWAFGGVIAATYLVSLPIAADINFALSARLRRALRRARAFLLFRRDAATRDALAADLATLRAETIALDNALSTTTAVI